MEPLQSGAGTINAGGDFINNGIFTAGTGIVNLVDGKILANIMGASQFYDLNGITTVGKQLNFEVAKAQTVTNKLTLKGVLVIS